MTIPQQPGPRRLGPLHTGTLPTAEQQFRPGGEFTLGAEEESLLVRRNGHLRSGGAERLATELARHPSAAGVVKPEIFANQIELNSVVCESAEQLHGSLAGLRADVRRAGAWLLATGVHPAARFGQVRTVRSARYDAIYAELGGLLRTPTSSLQVHVGFPDAETAMTAYAGLRHQLPILRALGASSPLWYGQDSGLVCARAAIMWSYPRVGIPPAVHDYEEYVDRATQAMAAAEVPDHSFLWWDMRVQPQLGTLEVRVMDTQTSLEQAAGLAALVQGIARAAVERPLFEDLPSEVLAENDFRAARFGLDARIVDSNGTMRPMRMIAGQALTRAREALRGDGLDAALDTVAHQLWEPSEAARQRRVFRDEGLPALLSDLTDRSNSVAVQPA
ncbi:MAG: YbdK family carboxylate-amine ligase [Nocardioidaceae bacterium]|nr:YbdK family carboxylate-amine ligase [Nocardioidaceae bacterium]